MLSKIAKYSTLTVLVHAAVVRLEEFVEEGLIEVPIEFGLVRGLLTAGTVALALGTLIMLMQGKLVLAHEGAHRMFYMLVVPILLLVAYENFVVGSAFAAYMWAMILLAPAVIGMLVAERLLRVPAIQSLFFTKDQIAAQMERYNGSSDPVDASSRNSAGGDHCATEGAKGKVTITNVNDAARGSDSISSNPVAEDTKGAASADLLAASPAPNRPSVSGDVPVAASTVVNEDTATATITAVVDDVAHHDAPSVENKTNIPNPNNETLPSSTSASTTIFDETDVNAQLESSLGDGDINAPPLNTEGANVVEDGLKETPTTEALLVPNVNSVAPDTNPLNTDPIGPSNNFDSLNVDSKTDVQANNAEPSALDADTLKKAVPPSEPPRNTTSDSDEPVSTPRAADNDSKKTVIQQEPLATPTQDPTVAATLDSIITN